MTAQDIVFNEDGRLRSGWRCCIFLAIFVLSTLVVGGMATALLLQTGYGNTESLITVFVSSLSGTVAALFAGILCGRLLERLPARSLGAGPSGPWLRNFAMGSLIGVVAIGIAVAIAAYRRRVIFFSRRMLRHLRYWGRSRYPSLCFLSRLRSKKFCSEVMCYRLSRGPDTLCSGSH